MHVFIGIPSAGHPHPWFAQALAQLVGRATREGVVDGSGKLVQPMIQTHVEIGKLPMVRNVLLKHAIASGASHMLWLDDDHVFPDWTLARLMLAQKEIVGINQPSRSRPHVPTARDVKAERLYGGEDLAKQGLVEQVGAIGFAVVLMDMKVIGRLKAKADEERRPFFPLFNFTLSEDPNVSGGEDGFFCARCREAGVPVHVDHMLSWATAHMAALPVTMADTLAHRDAADALSREG